MGGKSAAWRPRLSPLPIPQEEATVTRASDQGDKTRSPEATAAPVGTAVSGGLLDGCPFQTH